MKILIGTTNKDKFRQFKKAFDIHEKDFEVVSLAELGITDDVEEDGETLSENSRKKAQYFGKKSGLMTLADDTGLFVDALDGKPGIHAKRWHEGTYRDRNLKLLEELKDVSKEKRTARYIGVVSVYDPKNDIFWEFEKKTEGLICEEFFDEDGFGYDPIFWENTFGKRFSELTEGENLSISHRGMGVKELVDFLRIYVD